MKRIKSNFKNLPPYIADFRDYVINKRHNSERTANDITSRLLKVHNWLSLSKSYKKKHKDDWDKVIAMPIVFVDIKDMESFFNAQYHQTSANTRLAYKSAWNLFMVYAEISLGIENPIPDRHWKFIIVGKKNGQDKKKSELILNDDNVVQIIRTVYSTSNPSSRQRNSLILRTLIETGGRISEILSLHQSSFTLDDNNDTAIVINNTKTIQHRNPTRTLNISLDLYNAIQSYFSILRSEQQEFTLAFPTDKGAIINQNYYRITCIEPIAKELGLTGLHPHLFRHYRISEWCKSAVTEADMAKIAYWAGDTINTIRNVYLHIK